MDAEQEPVITPEVATKEIEANALTPQARDKLTRNDPNAQPSSTDLMRQKMDEMGLERNSFASDTTGLDESSLNPEAPEKSELSYGDRIVYSTEFMRLPKETRAQYDLAKKGDLGAGVRVARDLITDQVVRDLKKQL